MANWKRVITTDDDSSYKNSNLAASDIPADSITGTKIADDSIDSEHIVADSIDSEHYALGSVDRFAIGDNQVRAAALGDDAVTTVKIQDDAITSAKLAAGAVDIDAIGTNAVHTDELKAGAVTTAKIADDAVTFAKMQHTTVNNRVLGATTAGAIGQVQVSGSMIASDAITHGKIADGAIRAPLIAVDMINGHTAETSIADADEILIYDVSASANRKMTKSDFVSGLGVDTNLTKEEVEDFAGALVATGGTKTGISVTYDDANNNMDFVVSSQTDNNFTTTLKNKLDAIEASADVTDATNVTAAGALMDSEMTDLAGVKGVTISTLQVKPSEGAFANGDKTKLDGIEAGADVTDKINVASALNSNLGSLTIGDSNDTITIAGNLVVSGATTTVNTEEIKLADNTIVLNSNASGTPSEDGGIEVERGSRANVNLIWDESGHEWTSQVYKSSANDTTNYNGKIPVIQRASTGTSGSDTSVGSMFINTATGNVYIYS
tara:strand:- start:2268 stop:3749 length:1482 start_codon:yes stop_codon:yes gene_type:complete